MSRGKKRILRVLISDQAMHIAVDCITSFERFKQGGRADGFGHGVVVLVLLKCLNIE